MKNEYGEFEYEVIIESAREDKQRKSWFYVVQDCDGKRIPGEIRQEDLE